MEVLLFVICEFVLMPIQSIVESKWMAFIAPMLIPNSSTEFMLLPFQRIVA